MKYSPKIMRRETRISILSLLISLSLLGGSLWAQETTTEDPAEVIKLDKTFRRVAKTSIPKTVLVKSYISGTGSRAGYGTGAVISEDGYILTCSHVIDIAIRIEVVFPDESVYEATLLGKNREQDYALLKIKPKAKLPFFDIGKSSRLELGQWVVALGHPGGPYPDQQPAFAAGRVTRLHCKLPVQFMERFYNDGIQTDCPIYAGNSGGPLINLSGELVGLNGAILQINDNAYAVPIEQVMADYEKLKAGTIIVGEKPSPEALAEMREMLGPEELERMQKRIYGNLGKLFSGKDNPLSKMFGKGGPLNELFGADNPLNELFGGENESGGLLDQFSKLFGSDKDSQSMDFYGIIEQLRQLFGFGDSNDPNDPFKEFSKLFGGSEPSPPPAPAPRAKPTPRLERGYLGIVPASDSDIQNVGGVVLSQVVEGSPADSADLRKGDIVISVNGQATFSVANLSAALSRRRVGEKVSVKVIRTRLLDTTWVRDTIEIDVTLGKRK